MFGAHKPFGSENNGVCSIISNSNSSSNAEVPMPRFTNGHFHIKMRSYIKRDLKLWKHNKTKQTNGKIVKSEATFLSRSQIYFENF